MKYKSIERIQDRLAILEYYKGIVDGTWGPISDEAIRHAVNDKKVKVYFDFNTFKKLFGVKTLNQDFVDSINCLFEVFNKHNNIGGTSVLNVAYLLATSWHETAYTMLPIKEYGGDKYLSKYDTGRLARILGNTPEADGDGVFYAGRGHVMITGRNNYRKFSALLNIDLLKFPDLALDLKISAEILTVGSLKGMFTGKQLSDYIKFGYSDEFVSARKVINGTDKSQAIAEHAKKFVDCVVIV